METAHHFGRHGVHDIAHQSHRCRDGDGLVDEGEIVACGVFPWCFACLVHAQHIIAPLGEREEQREQECHQHQPLAGHNVGGIASGKHPQHEAEGDDAHIHNGILLELGAVEQVHHIVDDEHGTHCQRMCHGVEQQQGGQRAYQHEQHEQPCLDHAYCT